MGGDSGGARRRRRRPDADHGSHLRLAGLLGGTHDLEHGRERGRRCDLQGRVEGRRGRCSGGRLRRSPHRHRQRLADARRRALQGVAGRPAPGRERGLRPSRRAAARSRRDRDRRLPGTAAGLRPRRPGTRRRGGAKPFAMARSDDVRGGFRLARDRDAAPPARARTAHGRRLRARPLRRGHRAPAGASGGDGAGHPAPSRQTT